MVTENNCEASAYLEPPQSEEDRIMEVCAESCITDTLDCYFDCAGCNTYAGEENGEECHEECLAECTDCACCMCTESSPEYEWKGFVCTMASTMNYLTEGICDASASFPPVIPEMPKEPEKECVKVWECDNYEAVSWCRWDCDLRASEE
jgi:hypothetical protein